MLALHVAKCEEIDYRELFRTTRRKPSLASLRELILNFESIKSVKKRGRKRPLEPQLTPLSKVSVLVLVLV